MQVTDKDVFRSIGLEMDSETLINTCLSNEGFYQKLCNSKNFWDMKLQKDYPNVSNYYRRNNLPLKDAKKKYIETFQKERTLIEVASREYFKKIENKKLVQRIISFGIKNFIYKISKHPEYRAAFINRDKEKEKEIINSVVEDASKEFGIPKEDLESLYYVIDSRYLSYNTNSTYDIFKFL